MLLTPSLPRFTVDVSGTICGEAGSTMTGIEIEESSVAMMTDA
jgi:hypothetical protein